MSNIETLRRTDEARAGFAPSVSASHVATAIAAVIFTIAIVSLRPFQPAGLIGGAEEGGDVLNQLGFGAMGSLALIGMLCFCDPRRITALLSPWWILMLCFIVFGVLNALDPSSAGRAAAFTVIGIVVMGATVILPRDADALSTVLAFMSVTVLALSYAGLILMPDVAIHSTASQEPQHAGLWRGLFSHKNIAGPVMACISFAGFYLFRRGWRWIGAAILLAAMLFLANTGSKTTAGLAPLAIVLVVLPSIIGMRRATVLLFLLAIAGTAVATLGIVFISPVKTFAAEHFPGMTYTGRTALWAYAGEMLAQRPWTGYGFDSFWRTPIITNTVQPFDRDWDIRNIVHGHNGYLDVALTMGIPALIVMIFALVIEPVRDFMRIPHLRESVFLADFFMMSLLFTMLNGFLESFFFRRADPVWLFVVFSASGLRYVARFPLQTGRK